MTPCALVASTATRYRMNFMNSLLLSSLPRLLQCIRAASNSQPSINISQITVKIRCVFSTVCAMSFLRTHRPCHRPKQIVRLLRFARSAGLLSSSLNPGLSAKTGMTNVPNVSDKSRTLTVSIAFHECMVLDFFVIKSKLLLVLKGPVNLRTNHSKKSSFYTSLY